MLSHKTTTHTYEFNDNKTSFTITTDPSGELRCGQGGTIWDAALTLAKYIETPGFPHDLSHVKTVIDVGSGTGILGIFAAIYLDGRGIECRTILTDKKCVMPLLDMNARSVEGRLRSVKVTCLELEWGTKDLGLTGDLILISDCVVWPELFGPLIDTLEAICHANSIILLSYEKRKFDEEARFFYLLKEKFRFGLVKEEMLDERFRAPEDIFIFFLTKK